MCRRWHCFLLFGVMTIQRRFPGLNAVIPCLATAERLIYGTQSTNLIARFLKLRVMVGIGAYFVLALFVALASHCLHKANICFGIHPITFLRIVFCLFSISISLLAVCRAASKGYLAKYPKVILIGYGDPWDNS